MSTNIRTEQSSLVRLADRVRKSLSRVTGTSVSAIEDDLDLADDLGVDSIKLVALLNELASFVAPEIKTKLPELLSEQTNACRTVGELIALCEGRSAAAEPEPPLGEATSEDCALPVAIAQYPFLAAHWAISTCSIATRVRIRGRLTRALVENAWELTRLRHPALSSYLVIDPQATDLQACEFRVASELHSPVVWLDLGRLDEQAQDEIVRESLHGEINREWEITSAPLCRLSIFACGNDEFEALLSNHHLVSDGISNQIVVRDFLTICAAELSGQRPALAAPVSAEVYASLVARLNDGIEQRAQSYVTQATRSSATPGTRVAHARAKVETARRRIGAESLTRLKHTRRNWKAGTCALLVSAYTRALARSLRNDRNTANARSVLLNVPTSGRTYGPAELEQLVGCFAQNVTIEVRPDDALAVQIRDVQAALDQKLGDGSDAALTYRASRLIRSGMPLENAQPTALTRGILRETLSSHLYLSYIGDTKLAATYGPLTLLDYEAATTTNPGAIDLLIEEYNGELQLVVNFDTLTFRREQMLSLLENIEAELESIVLAEPRVDTVASAKSSAGIGAKVRGIVAELFGREVRPADMSSDLETALGLDSLQRVRLARVVGERVEHAHPEQVLHCRTLEEMALYIESLSPPEARTSEALGALPLEAFLDVAERTPGACAIRYKGVELSYAELEQWSRAIAEQLTKAGVGAGSLVGVLCTRGPQMLACNLGILRAGGAYVPLDVSQPEARLQEIIVTGDLRHVLVDDAAQQQRFTRLDGERRIHFQLAADGDPRLGRRPRSSSARDAGFALPDAASLMTVLFTSGSTGRPKGVMLAYDGYRNRLRWMQKAFPIAAGDRVAYKTSCCFDVSIWEWLWPLMEGATVCVAEEEIRHNPWALKRWLCEERVAIVHFVPSLFREFVAGLASRDRFPDLRWLIFSGEALPAPLVRAWMQRFGSTVGLANLYGPTEASIDVTSHVIETVPAEHEMDVPIGAPIDNVEAYVLDEQNRPVPTGTRGELWLGGVQLALGYLNNPEETARAFPKNPLSGTGVLYRTGDLASFDAEGKIHFHGRLDSQVKVRGFRIELGDVEAKLSALAGVAGCAVLAQPTDSGDLQLVAYVLPDKKGVSVPELRALAAERLPAYMVPQQWHVVSELTKNHNGKLDRKALLAQVKTSAETPLPSAQSCAPPDAGADRGHALGPAQKWLLAQFGQDARWLGFTRFTYKDELDLEVFSKALNWLLTQHDVLASTFDSKDGELRQRASVEARELEPHYADLATLPASAQQKTIAQFKTLALAALDLRRWPLLRVGIFRTAPARYEFVIAGHHMIADMLTNQILFRDLWRAYGELLSGAEPKPREHRTYRQYVERVGSLLGDADTRQRLREYWMSALDCGRATFFPTARDADRPNHELGSERLTVELDAATTRRLHQTTREASCRMYEAIAAALYHACASVSGRQRIVISHRMHGRSLEGENYFGTCGNFAVNYPVALGVDKNGDARALLPRIKTALAEVPWQGASYDAIASELPAAMYPDHKLTPIRLNFLPSTPKLPPDLFETDESEFDQRFSDPTQVRSAEIECFATEDSGALRLVFDFGERFQRGFIEALSEAMRAALEQIANTRPKLGKAVTDLVPFRGKESATARDERALTLSGKVAIVTGAGRGIGRAIALKLSRSGAKVMLAARTEHELRSVAAEVLAEGGECAFVSADVGTLDGAQRVVEQALEKFGRLDMLVNNAGRTQCSSVLQSSPEEWTSVVATNLFGTFYMSKLAVPALLESEGVIVNIGSDSSVIGYPLFSAYAASKHGIVGLTKSLAEELKPHNVQVNAVCPAMVDTEMAPAGLRAKAIAPEQVAGVVAFLVSPEAQMITGECIRVYGKQDMYWYGSRQAQQLENVAPPKLKKSTNGVNNNNRNGRSHLLKGMSALGTQDGGE